MNYSRLELYMKPKINKNCWSIAAQSKLNRILFNKKNIYPLTLNL